MVLLDGLPGEEQEEQQYGDTEDRGAPTAHHRTHPAQAMSHQDTITHTGEGSKEGEERSNKRRKERDIMDRREGERQKKQLTFISMIKFVLLSSISYTTSSQVSSLNTLLSIHPT